MCELEVMEAWAGPGSKGRVYLGDLCLPRLAYSVPCDNVDSVPIDTYCRCFPGILPQLDTGESPFLSFCLITSS